MVSPLTGKALAAEVTRQGTHKPADAAHLKDRLARIELRSDEKAKAQSSRGDQE
jgi:hypothetical protein